EAARAAYRVRGPCRGLGGVVRGRSGRHAPQSCDQILLRAPAGRGQSQEGRPVGLQAQAVDHHERHGALSEAVATSGGAERIRTSKGPLTIKTVAHPLEHVEDLAARSAEAMAEEIISNTCQV